MKDLKNENERLRGRFKEYLENNYNPSLRILHKAIGLGYSALVSWKVGNHEYGIKNLKKIEEFLDSKMIQGE